jgi:filamentous hemagglutinin
MYFLGWERPELRPDNLERRAGEQLLERGISIDPIPGLQNLARADARAVEQQLIERYGLIKNGGTLINKINSIATSNSIYVSSVARGQQILAMAGV